MCNSNEVYMTEKNTNLDVGDARGLSFDASAGRESDVFYFDTYVCLACGYTALFAHSGRAMPLGLAVLKKVKGWKKVG